VKACALLFTFCIFFLCPGSGILGSFLSVIVFCFVPAVHITDAAFVIKKQNREHILCDQSRNLVFFVEYEGRTESHEQQFFVK